MKESNLFKRSYSNPNVIEVINLLCASSVYFVLLLIPPPPYISQALNQSGWMILILVAGIFALLLRQKGTGWEAVQSSLIFALFALLLIHQWQTVPNYGEIIGGLLPWSDASDYVQQAEHLLNGLLFTSFGGRPLFPAFLAVLLFITSRNYMVTLALLTWVNALAVLFVVREIKRSYGALGASVLLIFAYKFYLRFAGTTMTEQLGFGFGNLALFFLLVAAQNKSLKHALLGLGLLSLALNARAGALFILPTLILWLVITFSSKTGLWRTLGLGIVVVALPFVLNSLLFKATVDPRSAPFANYSYILYGLASGNKDWTQVIYDHPNVYESEVMSLALQKIRSNPILLFKGMLGSVHDYFIPLNGAFTFIVYSLYSFRVKANIILWFLTLIGLTRAVLNWTKGNHGLLLASFIGVFTSLTLVPSTYSDGMRIYAATILFTGLWVVEGIYVLIFWCRKLLKQQADNIREAVGLPIQRLAIGFSTVLVVLAIPVPILLHSILRSSDISTHLLLQTSCHPDEQLMQGFELGNSRIVLIPDEAANESYMPFIRTVDFRSAVVNNFLETPILGQKLLGLQAGEQISFGFDTNNKKEWLVSSFPVEAGMFSACGHVSENQELRQYRFYFLTGSMVHPSSMTISQQYPTVTLLLRLLYGFGGIIIIFLIAKDFFKFGRRSLLENILVLSATGLILIGVFVALYAQAVITLPFAEQRTTLQMNDAVPKKPTHLYILPLGINWMSQTDLGSSPAVVNENGTPLASPNSLPQTIKDRGDGSYGLWNESLYFSSSDNTDPHSNGRKYELAWPRPIRPILQWIVYLGSLLGAIMLVFREKLTRTIESRSAKKDPTHTISSLK